MREVTLLRELSCRIYKIFTSGQYGGLSQRLNKDLIEMSTPGLQYSKISILRSLLNCEWYLMYQGDKHSGLWTINATKRKAEQWLMKYPLSVDA